MTSPAGEQLHPFECERCSLLNELHCGAPSGGSTAGISDRVAGRQTRPVVSTLNNPTATVVANAAIVAAGTVGGIAVYPDATTDLVVDIDGYFAAPGQNGYSFYPVAPCRAFDSRNNNGQPFTGELTIDVAAIRARCQLILRDTS